MQAFMVREYLSIDSVFTAFGELPVGREWRVFAGLDGVRCHHFYWPEDAKGAPNLSPVSGIRIKPAVNFPSVQDAQLPAAQIDFPLPSR
jgi:hypothetical protein